MPPYCSLIELLAVLDRSPTDDFDEILLKASAWCDSYLDVSTLYAHFHCESKQMRPDRDGRLLWRPEHAPFIHLGSLSYGRSPEALTTYREPAVVLENDRTVVVDCRTLTASWSGSLQFGISSDEVFTTWCYRAGYSTIPSAIRKATALYGASLLTPEAALIEEAESLLDPYRWI